MIKRIKFAFVIVGLGMLPAMVAQAQSNGPDWLFDLSIQLQVQNGCTVAYFEESNERDGPDGRSFRARAHCEDGRTYEAERTESEWGFTVKLINTAGC